MNTGKVSPGSPRYLLLERTTAVILLLVLLALGWMVLAACVPEFSAGVALPIQVGLSLVLLMAALVLVSIVALLHTRS